MPLGLISHLMVPLSDILTGKVNLNVHVSQMVLREAVKRGKEVRTSLQFLELD